LRILMLAQFYSPVVGGEEQLVRTLSIELAARGHAVSVATQSHPAAPAFEIDAGVRVHRIQGMLHHLPGLFKEAERQHAPPFPDPLLSWEIARIVAQERPQIVHAHNWIDRSFLPLKRRNGPRFVVSLHDFSRPCAKKNLVYRELPCSGPGLTRCPECAAAHFGLVKGAMTVLGNWATMPFEQRLVDMYLPVSQAVAERNGLRTGRVPFEVVPNFLPDTPARADASHADLEPYLSRLPQSDFMMYAGDLSRIKGIHILLQAYAELTGPDVPPLVLIGRVVRETPADLPANVWVLGRWPHAAVMAAWRRSMLGFLPSIWEEPFGIVLLEAMSCGQPVIASRIGGIVDFVIDGDGGLLVEPGNVASLRNAIQRLLQDPQLRQRMGLAARRRAMEFQARDVIPRFERVYKSLLGGG
jgi:glycosyltransferase involved in cell wall biosynthesis